MLNTSITPAITGNTIAPHNLNKDTKQLRAVTYSRVSIEDSSSESLDIQERGNVKHGIEQDYIIVGTFRENFTGMLYRERQELSNMRKMIRNGEVDVVIIHSVERLSRVALHIAVLLEEMLNHGVLLECVTEQIDTSPLGQTVIQLLALAGQIERERIIERTTRQRKKRYEAGQMIGTGTPLFGYTWGDKEKTHYVIDEEQAEIVGLIFHLYTHLGYSICQICIYLNERGVKTPGYIRSERAKDNPRSRKTLPKNQWGVAMVARILGHPGYKGQALVKVQGKTIVEGKVKGIRYTNPLELPEGTIPPIVTTKDWEEAQRLKKANKDEARREAIETEDGLLLKHGVARCGYCNGSMIKSRMHNGKTRKPWYIYHCHRTGKINRAHCPCPPSMSANRLDTYVWEFVSSLQDQANEIYATLREEATNIIIDTNEIDTSIDRTQTLILRILKERRDLDTNGLAYQTLTEELLENEKMLKDLKALKDQALPSVEQSKKQAEEITEFLQWFTSVSDLKNTTLEEKRRAIRILGIEVFVYQKEDVEHPRYKIVLRKELRDICNISTPL